MINIQRSRGEATTTNKRGADSTAPQHELPKTEAAKAKRETETGKVKQKKAKPIAQNRNQASEIRDARYAFYMYARIRKIHAVLAIFLPWLRNDISSAWWELPHYVYSSTLETPIFAPEGDDSVASPVIAIKDSRLPFGHLAKFATNGRRSHLFKP